MWASGCLGVGAWERGEKGAWENGSVGAGGALVLPCSHAPNSVEGTSAAQESRPSEPRSVGLEANLRVAAVAERLVVGASTAAERHARVDEQRLAVVVRQLHVAANEKGAVRRQRDAILVGRRLGGFAVAREVEGPVGR